MDFSESCVDVGYLIQNMDEEDRNKIPSDLIETINYYKSDKYKTKINILAPLENQTLSKTTMEMISFIYYNYLGTPEEKKEYNNGYNNYLKMKDTNILKDKKTNKNYNISIMPKQNKKSIFGIIIETIKNFFK